MEINPIFSFYVVTNQIGNYFRGKTLGWTPFLTEALLITDLDILSDIIQWDDKFMKIVHYGIKSLGGGKNIFIELDK